MNLTLSIDDKLAGRAREVARQQGTSLNALVRDFIEKLAGERGGEDLAAELERCWRETPGHSTGRSWRRDDAYEGRLR